MSVVEARLDLVIRDGTVITMDRQRRVMRADLIIRRDRIVGIERPGQARGSARVIEAAGCAVIPGFVQAHVHLAQALFRGMADDLPLLEWLRKRIWPLEVAHDPASLRASARLGLAELLRGGTTTILDLGTVHHQDAVLEAMAESGIRGASGKSMIDRGTGVPKRMRESTRESLRESEALCDRWHGAHEGRIRYAFAPRFILSCSEDLMRETVALARDRHALVHSHASEHRGERDEVRKAFGKDDVDVLASWGVAGPDVVLAHGVQLGRPHMKRMADRGTRIVHCPSANLKLASGIADVVGMRQAGMVVGLGSDGAPCNNRMDALTEMRAAALLAKVRREDAAALSAIDALALATIEGARALGLDKEIGSIEIGKKADVVVMRIDDLHHEPGIQAIDGHATSEERAADAASRVVYGGAASDVTDVVVDGKVVVEQRSLRTLPVDEVLADARREALKLRARAELR